MPFQEARQRAHEMLDFVGMGQERYRMVDTYSTGMKQRVKLAQAIVHDPEIVFLDEPTNGLDPAGREQILELIRSLWVEHGISVVLSSHLLSDVERICDQIVIIALGSVLMQDRIDRLKAQRQPCTEIITESASEKTIACMQRAGWKATQLPNGHVQVEHDCSHLGPLIAALDADGITPLEMLQSPNQLETLFVQALETSHGHSL
jgi:ABC-2 type transport system ATP-binding protein